MKILLTLILFTGIALAQTTKATSSDSAQLITSGGTTSLSPEETDTLKRAIQVAHQARAVAQVADEKLQDVQKTIAVNHAAPVDGPYQIVTDFSTTIDRVPPAPVQVWTKVADENDIVLIKAGTTVRYGAPKDSPNLYAIGGVTATDAWNPPVTYTADSTLTVNNGSLGPDPINGTLKELDQLGTAGGVARTTAQ